MAVIGVAAMVPPRCGSFVEVTVHPTGSPLSRHHTNVVPVYVVVGTRGRAHVGTFKGHSSWPLSQRRRIVWSLPSPRASCTTVITASRVPERGYHRRSQRDGSGRELQQGTPACK